MKGCAIFFFFAFFFIYSLFFLYILPLSYRTSLSPTLRHVLQPIELINDVLEPIGSRGVGKLLHERRDECSCFLHTRRAKVGKLGALEIVETTPFLQDRLDLVLDSDIATETAEP